MKYFKFQNSHIYTSIRVVSSDGLHYDGKASSEGSHLLTLNYSVTGVLEISVTFANSSTAVTHYLGKTACI